MKDSQNSGKPIIFVVGNSRSGTSMMSRILGNNKEVFTFRELHFFEHLWSIRDKERLLSNREATALITRLICIQRKERFRNKVISKHTNEAERIVNLSSHDKLTALNLYKDFLFYEAKKNEKCIPCEQTPRYVIFLSEILEFFPNAKIINMIRDPRDVLLSQKRKWKRRFFLGGKNFPIKESIRMWANYHPFIISKLWEMSINSVTKHAKSEKVLFINFEDLIEKPEDCVRNVCDFIGITYNHSMPEVPQVGSSNFMNQPDKKGINKATVGNWSKGGLNSSEIYVCQKTTGYLMNQYGYVVTDLKPNRFLLIFYKISLLIKLFLSFCLNFRRMKNMREAISRRLQWTK